MTAARSEERAGGCLCVHTRIYGNGAHRRRIADGLCPAATSDVWGAGQA
jgi:hypothetical protein